MQRAIDGELWLLQPHVRTSPAQLEARLHPEFFEVGASGRRWSRREVIEELPPAEAAGAEPPVVASDVTGAASGERAPGAVAQRAGVPARHRSVRARPRSASISRSAGRDRPITVLGWPSMLATNAPPRPSMLNAPATASGSPLAT